jgi:uncharacterized protein YdaU (DUF1376 family)
VAPKRKKAPAFQWYPRDFMSDALVISMTLEQEGAYRRLMDVCWLENGLPSDVEHLWRLAKAPTRERFARHIWPLVGQKFQLKNGRWHHKRLDQERRKQAKTRQARKLAADKRWADEGCKSNANASGLQCLTSALTSASATAVGKRKTTDAAASDDSRRVTNGRKGNGSESDRLAPVVRGFSGHPPGGAVNAGQRVEGPDQGSFGEVAVSVSEPGSDSQGDGLHDAGVRTHERPTPGGSPEGAGAHPSPASGPALVGDEARPRRRDVPPGSSSDHPALRSLRRVISAADGWKEPA